MIKADELFIENLKRLKSIDASWDKNPRAKYESDNSPAHTVFITQVFQEFDLSKNEFPIITLRPTAFKSGLKELEWIYSDQTSNLDVLNNKYGVSWWNNWKVESEDIQNSIGRRYGATVKKYDLMNNLLNGLTNDPFGRRHIMSLYQNADFEETDGLYPCAFMTMWTVRELGDEMYLDMTLIQRSSDYVVSSSINQSQYVCLMMKVAKHCGFKLGKFVHFIQNLHCYDRHLKQVDELLSRTPVNLQPIIELNVPDGTNFYDIKVDDFSLINYEPIKPQLKFELAI